MCVIEDVVIVQSPDWMSRQRTVMAKNQNIKIRFFADTHLGFDYPLRPRIPRRRRGQDFFDNFHRVLDSAAASKIDILIHGGDLFFRSRVPSKIVDLTYSALFEFAEKGMPVVIVPGNHERSRLPTSLYLAHPNIHVFAAPMTYKFDFGNIRVCISGFPFERNNIKNRFRSILKETGWEGTDGDIKLLCIHQAVEGAQVGPADYTFRNGEDVIRFDDLPNEFHAVLAGHIHRKQILDGKASKEGKALQVIYPGSTERTSFAEKNEAKGFFDVTFGTINKDGWQIAGLEFMQLPTRPMADLYLTNNVNESNLKPFLLAHIKNFDKNAIVRIKCTGKVNEGVKGQLTSSYLRNIFPNSMNVQLGTEFHLFEPKKKMR